MESSTVSLTFGLEQKFQDLIKQFPFLKLFVDGKNIKIFGGFARWVVENENQNVTASDFLNTGSDIDIKVGLNGKHDLLNLFENIFANSGTVEYAGIKYDGKTMETVNFNIFQIKKKDRPIPIGHYMIWVPVRSRENGVLYPSSDSKKWLKYDIIFGEHCVATDYTVNLLTYPFVNFLEGTLKVILDDIRNRRIRWRTDIISPKIFYRASKLLKKGYTVFDALRFMEMFKFCTEPQFFYKPRQSKHAKLRSREIEDFMFISDTNSPSLEILPNVVRTTNHQVTKITPEMIKTNEYIAPIVEYFSKVYTRDLLTPENWDGSTTRGIISRTMSFFKLCRISNGKNADTWVCLKLLVCPDTKYVVKYQNGSKKYRFDKVTVEKCYAYPHVPIVIPPTHKILSLHKSFELLPNSGFEYSLTGETIALDDKGVPVKVSLDHLYGIYAFTTLDEAWSSYTENYLHSSDVDSYFSK